MTWCGAVETIGVLYVLAGVARFRMGDHKGFLATNSCHAYKDSDPYKQPKKIKKKKNSKLPNLSVLIRAECTYRPVLLISGWVTNLDF